MTATILEVIDRGYAAAHGERGWPHALAALADLLGGAGATLEVIAKADRRPVRLECARLEAAAPYVEEYAPLSPRAPRFAGEPAGFIGHDRACLSPAAMARHPFYTEFLAPQGLRYFVAGNLDSDDERLAVVTVQRTPAQGHVGVREVRLLAAVLPHLRRAVALGETLAAAQGAREVVARSRLGVVFLDRHGRVTGSNAAADAILGVGGSALGRRGGRLCAGDPAVQRRLDGLLASALAGPLGGGSLVIEPLAAEPLRVTVRGLPPQRGRPAAVVYLVAGRRALRLEPTVLREAYGLTAAEARLALALAAGATPADHAQASGVAISTVRTHLARVLAKTGTGSQRQLIRLLDGLAQGPP